MFYYKIPWFYRDFKMENQFYQVFKICTQLTLQVYWVLREKCPNMEVFLVRIFPHSN